MAVTRVPSGATLCGPVSNVAPLTVQQLQATTGELLLNSSSTRSSETYSNGTSAR